MASYRNLKAWQHAKTLSVACTKASRLFPADEQDNGLANQLRRAAASAALNIAEGNNRTSNRVRRFLETARTSLDEVGVLYGLLRSVKLRLERGEVVRSRRPATSPGPAPLEPDPL